MAAAAAVRVSVDHRSPLEDLPQDAASGMEGNVLQGAAAVLLAALTAPMVLKWELPLPTGGFVALSADVNPSAPGAPIEWPPPHLTLRVGAAHGDAKAVPSREIRVSSRLTAEQLGVVIAGSLAARSENPAADEDSPTSADEDSPTSATVVDTDHGRCITQPRCVRQWHHDVCGHHALFNVRQLLRSLDGSEPQVSGDPPAALLDEASFWQSALENVAALADYGEETGKWPRSRVTCGVLDEIHLAQLINGDSSLRGRVSIVPHPFALGPDTEAGCALAGVAEGREAAHGFVLGCAIHWVSLVVQKAPVGHHIWLCDSYNRPMAQLLALSDLREVAEKHELRWRENSRQSLRTHPHWEHQPEHNLERALDDGVAEWWKGTQKTPLFWKWKPRDVRLTLATQELEHIRQYLEAVVAALAPKPSL